MKKQRIEYIRRMFAAYYVYATRIHEQTTVVSFKSRLYSKMNVSTEVAAAAEACVAPRVCYEWKALVRFDTIGRCDCLCVCVCGADVQVFNVVLKDTWRKLAKKKAALVRI